MNDFLISRRDCLLGIKAFQNFRASSMAWERLCGLVDSEDHVLLSAYFHAAIIRYAKPFLGSNLAGKTVMYPVKPLKRLAGFDMKLHEHLIQVRNALVAHDDFDKIEPRLLTFGITLRGTNKHIPVSVAISNKCISHPADLNEGLLIKGHLANALQGAMDKLHKDMKRFREISLMFPEQAESSTRYNANIGEQHIPIDRVQLNPPDFMSDKWLDSPEPTFSEIRNGFRYEKIALKQDFYGPETITFPDGSSVVISPP